MNRLSFLRVLTASLLLAALAPLHADDQHPVVVLKTSLGTITVQLDAVKAPLSTANFLSYVDAKAYDGTIFHRVIPNFCVQGGGFKPGDLDHEIPTHAPVKNESLNGLKNLRGTIALARTNDPDSATSQFFFNLIDDAHLDPDLNGIGYAVFGKITDGLDVIDKIAQVPTTTAPNGFENVPVTPVILISARRE